MLKKSKQELIQNQKEVSPKGVTIKEFCEVCGIPERSFYLWKTVKEDKKRGRKKPPKNKLTTSEVAEVKKILLDPDLVDYSPREIYYKKLDEEKKIIASISSFYRIARSENLLTKRVKTGLGNKLNREMPHLLATSINQIWSWDVSQILSSTRITRYYLYVIVDIWSRLVVAWRLENHEQTDHAIAMWKCALEQQLISGHGLINHKDNGSIMTAKDMITFVRAAQMVDSYSRAGVSDDNPFSEALFRTIKYFRKFPNYFDTIENGRNYFDKYFEDYNYTFRHSGIQFLTPAQRHYGEEEKILNIRNKTATEFYHKNSHRYSSKHKLFMPIKEVKIN